MTGGWEAYLRTRFPAWLLPASHREALSEAEAKAFLARVHGRPDTLTALALSAALAKERTALITLASELLPDLLRHLRMRSRVERVTASGYVPGRLDVQRTQRAHLTGRVDLFAGSRRHRDPASPAHQVVVSTIARLAEVVSRLAPLGLLTDAAWGRGIPTAVASLGAQWRHGPLAAIDPVPVGTYELRAAAEHSHLAAKTCAHLWSVLDDALTMDDARRARLLAEGALLPANDFKRFELAVLVRLCEALEARLRPDGWSVEQSAVITGRADIFAFHHGNTRIRVLYDQAPPVPDGPRNLGVKHFLGGAAARPDITVLIEQDGAIARLLPVEVKRSDDVGYLVGGYGEAMVYRWEYAPWTLRWPKAMLVTDGPVSGRVTSAHEVLVQSWGEWPSAAVVEAVVGACSAPG